MQALEGSPDHPAPCTVGKTGSPSPGKVLPLPDSGGGLQAGAFLLRNSSLPLAGPGWGKFKEALTAGCAEPRPRGTRVHPVCQEWLVEGHREHTGVLCAPAVAVLSAPWTVEAGREHANSMLPRKGSLSSHPAPPRPLGASRTHQSAPEPTELHREHPWGSSLNVPHESLLSTFCVPGCLPKGSVHCLSPGRWPWCVGSVVQPILCSWALQWMVRPGCSWTALSDPDSWEDLKARVTGQLMAGR